MIKLQLPLIDIQINQPFGVNYLDFYKKNFGLNGHPGIDFRAYRGCKILAANSGVISWCGNGKDKGIGIEIWDKKNNFKTFYYHHLSNKPEIQIGREVKAGSIIAEADNTGIYTTGDHEHFELYLTDEKGNTINKDNGFGGSIDPAPYFAERYGKDWDKPRAYNRYGRNQVWLAEWEMRFKNIWLHKQLIKRGRNPIMNIEEINALVYGGWDFETVVNPSMHDIWGFLTKNEYNRGRRAFK